MLTHSLSGFVPTDNVALVDPSDGGLLEYALDPLCVHRANPGHHDAAGGGAAFGTISGSLSKKVRTFRINRRVRYSRRVFDHFRAVARAVRSASKASGTCGTRA